MRFLHLHNLTKESKFHPDHLLSIGATVAYERPSPETVRFAVAYASIYDNFSKKRGRQIASGRLKVNRGHVITLPAAPGKAIEVIKTHLGAE